MSYTYTLNTTMESQEYESREAVIVALGGIPSHVVRNLAPEIVLFVVFESCSFSYKRAIGLSYSRQ